jgi:acetyl esterase/lipase
MKLRNPSYVYINWLSQQQAVLTVSLLLLLSMTSFSQDSVYKPVSFPAHYKAAIDEIYKEISGFEGRVDVYYPEHSKDLHPLVLNIHGGGWNKGVKESQTGFSTFFKEGFVVANVAYRLSQQATAPAAIEDVRCALVYLVKHAQTFRIDVNRIVVMGGSAGGHLALMAGLVGSSTLFDKDCITSVPPFKVAAIIDKYGIVDLWDWAYGKQITSKSATQWLGPKANDASFAKLVSPIYYVQADSPPIFIVHGDADPTVPIEHSQRLVAACVEKKVPHTYMVIPQGLHGKFSKEENSQINTRIIQFLKEQKIIF